MGLHDFMKMAGTLDVRLVARDDVDGFTISTALTDMGYETAILDYGPEWVTPVERYATRELAVEGHAKWCKDVVGKSEFVKLDWLGLFEDRVVTLIRRPENTPDLG